jgi:uncharacterized integral membrane protein
MKALGMVIFALLALLGIFTLANWSALNEHMLLSFLFFDVQGPLGVVLLAVIVAFAVLMLIYGLTLKTQMLLESRQHVQELTAQRRLAEEAETSRIVQLSEQFDLRFTQLEKDMSQAIEQSANSVIAHIAQLDDRLRNSEQQDI